MEDTGGTTSTMCEITPSDLAGMVDNLVSRVVNLEQTVSQLLGVNMEANQLSDISEDLGWVTGVTYLGEEGWTQTPSGTLIPPAGWTGLSSVIDGVTGWSSGAGLKAAISLESTGSSYPSWLGDNIDWDVKRYEKGSGVFTWPYSGNNDQIYLNKVGWYIFSCQAHASSLTGELFGIKNTAVYQQDAISFKSSTDASGESWAILSHLGYVTPARTSVIQFVFGNNNMSVDAFYQIGYLGA